VKRITKMIATQALVASLMSAGLITGATTAGAALGDREAPASQQSTPVVTGPVTGGHGAPTLGPPVPNTALPTLGPPVPNTAFDLADVGYTSEEYFLSGSATAYSSSAPLTPDGEWTAQRAGTAPYTTRIVAHRPSNQKKFNGTVVVEWLNVSGDSDVSPIWVMSHNEMIRDGFAWVGVSAQSTGVSSLQAADPDRYGSLSHPGDSYSYDILSQAGQVLRKPTNSHALGGLEAKRVIAAGTSQSASRLVTYVNAVHPLTKAFDGFLIRSRLGRDGAALSQAPLPTISAPDATVVRSDLDVPVLTLQTETDLIGLEYHRARQRDTKHFRLWEVAGTAHGDAYYADNWADDTGKGNAEVALLDVTSPPRPPCERLINLGPQYAVEQAALYHLDRWVRRGVTPPRAPRLAVEAGPTPTIRRDEYGNALGGIRTPLVDVPIATIRGDGNLGPRPCPNFGSTAPFDDATLASLYPSHAAYVAKFNRATDEAAKRGFLLRPEAKSLKTAAAASSIGPGN
jgi:Alpha/beta hydrolase domain